MIFCHLGAISWDGDLVHVRVNLIYSILTIHQNWLPTNIHHSLSTLGGYSIDSIINRLLPVSRDLTILKNVEMLDILISNSHSPLSSMLIGQKWGSLIKVDMSWLVFDTRIIAARLFLEYMRYRDKNNVLDGFVLNKHFSLWETVCWNVQLRTTIR